MLNNDKFIQTFTGLCEVFNKEPSEYLIEIYYEIFKDFDIRQFNNAVMMCIKSNKYNVLPKPAEILEFLEGSKDDKALLAWIQAKEGVQKCGYYRTPEFKDPIISHCIEELGGWMAFCSIEIEELKFVEKRFMDFYRLYYKRETKEPKNIIGFIDLSNNQNGYEQKGTVKIGYDEEIKSIGIDT